MVIESLAEKLKGKDLSLCTAESCTGGLIGKLCTELPGSSEWFAGGMIVYLNRLKESLLKVPGELINTHGAVSLPVAEQMALGALQACSTSCAIAVSGIAGPGGGTMLKPVGTVCIAVAVPEVFAPNHTLLPQATQADLKVKRMRQLISAGAYVFSLHCRLDGTRDEIRQAAAYAALYELSALL